MFRKSEPRKSAPTVKPAAPAPVEALEGRQLMTATLSGSTLNVYGTVYNDDIRLSAGSGLIHVYQSGVTQSFNAASVAAVNVYAYAGHDYVRSDLSLGIYAQGSDGNDTLIGGSGADRLDGWNGNDYVYGQGGNDTLWGYFGNDYISGGTGADSMYGESDSDTLHGGSGRDYMSGGAGNDFFYAKDDEDDTLNGGDGWDTAQVDDEPWYAPWEAEDSLSGVENAFEP